MNAMKITICIGSVCRLKGSAKVIEELKSLIATNNLNEKVALEGTFAEAEVESVAVWVDGEVYSVTPETVGEFFNNNVLAKLA